MAVCELLSLWRFSGVKPGLIPHVKMSLRCCSRVPPLGATGSGHLCSREWGVPSLPCSYPLAAHLSQAHCLLCQVSSPPTLGFSYSLTMQSAEQIQLIGASFFFPPSGLNQLFCTNLAPSISPPYFPIGNITIQIFP